MECDKVHCLLSAQKTKQNADLTKIARETQVGNQKHRGHHITKPWVSGQR